MAKYVKKYSYKGYKIRETAEGCFDLFKPSWDPNEPIFEEMSNIEDAKTWINSDIESDNKDRKLKEDAVRDYAKRFQMICEYSFGTRLEEDDADPNAAPANQNAAPPVGGDPNAAAGGVQNTAPGDTNADSNAAPADANADPNAMAPEEDSEFEDIDIEEDEGGLQPDDNVIDVSQITGAQEETNDEVKSLSDKFEKLLQANDKVVKALERMSQSAEDNKREIQTVKDDIAQRIPTEIEKLKGRIKQSEPYGQTVEDYWKQRSTGDKYDVYPDKEQEYVLRKSDVEQINPQTVYNSFNQKLRDIVGW